MLPDQLTRSERIRLEALSQACAVSHTVGIDGKDRAEAYQNLLERAEDIERWLRSAREDA